MPSSVTLLLSAMLAYFIGSVPFSLIIARWATGIDLRKHGSGNIGATNVARTLGMKWGLFALLMDATKGMASVALIPVLLKCSDDMIVHQRVIGAVFAVVGHMFSAWLNFRGGKGVATALGAVLWLSPWSTLFSFLAFAIVFSAKRIVSLSSITAAITFAVAQLILFRESLWSSTNWSLGLFSIMVPSLIIFQHRSNIVRLIKGEEAKLVLSKRAQKDSESST